MITQMTKTFYKNTKDTYTKGRQFKTKEELLSNVKKGDVVYKVIGKMVWTYKTVSDWKPFEYNSNSIICDAIEIKNNRQRWSYETTYPSIISSTDTFNAGTKGVFKDRRKAKRFARYNQPWTV